MTNDKLTPVLKKVSKLQPGWSVRFHPTDKNAIFSIWRKYKLKNAAKTIRLALRIVEVLDLSPEKVRKLNERYEKENPTSKRIKFDV